nr:SusD/RagB family nutrient-binding outer membrane lipoprotein [Bacteroides intestinalis]
MKTMKYIKQSLFAFSAIGISIIWNGCTSSFDDLNTNPDATTKVTPALLATKVILDHVKSASSDNNEFMCKRMFWGEQMDNYQYNRVEKGSFSAIQGLTNAQKMVELASESNKDAYTGLYYYLKGWAFYRTTMDMGDIPYSEALQVNEFRYLKVLVIPQTKSGVRFPTLVLKFCFTGIPPLCIIFPSGSLSQS